MSLIIDGMDQGKCLIPYAGRQDTFKDAMHMHITGVKEHGVGLTIYRTTETVAKGANLTIHCILDRLKKFNDKHHYYPEILYLQIDGGSENANKYLLAMLELLVAKRICKDVWFTRLPTGHTHEDIDGVFGTIWAGLCGDPLFTLEAWKAQIEKIFAATTLKAEVTDIWVMPDYKAVIQSCIIEGFERLHRDLHTQHQWRFRAVEKCDFFPFGCKTTYRAYSSDCVVEFIRKPRHSCITQIGRQTGLEATKLFVRWFPSSSCDPRRPGVEGMYLLERLPSIVLAPGAIVPPPVPIPDGAVQTMNKCFTEICKRFDPVDDFNVRQCWKAWSKVYLPPSNDVKDYVRQLRSNHIPYIVPLQDVLFDLAQHLTPQTFSISIDDYADYDPDFQWPDVFARSTNSVQSSRFNPNPPEPREYASTDICFQEAISTWNHETAQYYHQTLDAKTTEYLKNIMKRKVKYGGEIPSSTGTLTVQIACLCCLTCLLLPFIGTKTVLIERLKVLDTDVFVVIHQRLTPIDLLEVERTLLYDTAMGETVNNRVFSTINDLPIRGNAIRSLRAAEQLSREMANGALQLFVLRDLQIEEDSNTTNRSRARYTPYKRSQYLGPQFFEDLMRNPELVAQRFPNHELRNAFRIYCMLETLCQTRRSWQLLVLDMEARRFHLLNPSVAIGSFQHDITLQSGIEEFSNVSYTMDQIKQSLNSFLGAALGETRGAEWNFTAMELLQRYEINEDDFSEGAYVLAMIYYLSYDLPMTFKRSQIQALRRKWVFWTLLKRLPV